MSSGRIAKSSSQGVTLFLEPGVPLSTWLSAQFSGVSGETKALIDRAQCCWVEKYRLKRAPSEVEGERRGLFVATCGGKDARVFDWAKHTVEAFFNSTGFRYWGELFEASTDAAPPMTERGLLLAEAEALGRKIAAE